MNRTALALLLAGFVFVAAFARDDEQPKKDDTDKPRLKPKKRDKEPPPIKEEKDKEKAKEEKDKDKAKVEKDKDKKDKEKAKEDELIPEDGPMGDPQEDERDVLERVSRNMRGAQDKLSNKETGDPTQQQQRDVLKDLDDLINRSQQQEQGGGGGGGAQQQQQDDQNDQDKQNQQGGAQKQQRTKAGQKMTQKQGQQQQARAQRQPRPRNQMARNDPKEGEGKGEKQKPMGGGGEDPGQGGNSDRGKETDEKQYKDVWGHLPESLRAEMNAYSNPKPFMPRYDDLIKKYYRTIAEQGRKKGD